MLPSSDNYLKVLDSRFPKEYFIKMEIYDSEMNYINEISRNIVKNDVGSISVDRSRPIRRTFSFTLNNSKGEFTWGKDNLIWIDKRIKVFHGLKLRTGEIEYIPQGVFLLTEPSDSHTFGGKTVSLSGHDKAFLFTDKRGKFVNEQIIETGVNVATAIRLIAEGNGETLFLFDDVSDTVPYELTYSSSDNRWNAMEELAKLAKCELYYDVNGYLRLQKVEDLNDLQNESSVWSFNIGDNFYAGNVRKMDEGNLYNNFVTVGGGSLTETVRHILTVTETNPIFANNPYSVEKLGYITYFHNSGNADPLLSTVDECLYRNKYELMQKLGYVERVVVTIAPHYLLDVSDIVEINDSNNNVSGRYRIEKIDIPLIPQAVNMEVAKEERIIDDWDFI